MAKRKKLKCKRLRDAFLEVVWCNAQVSSFDILIKTALQAEATALDRDRLSTLPIPLPHPELCRIREIGTRFNEIATGIIETRSSTLRLDWEPPDPPDPPNQRNLVSNNLEHALLLTKLLKTEIENAQEAGILSDDWARELHQYQICLSDLISAIPINLP